GDFFALKWNGFAGDSSLPWSAEIHRIQRWLFGNRFIQPLHSTPMNRFILAQTEAYEPGAAETVGGFVGGLLYLGFIVVLIAAMWKIFTKAGKPGWAAIVPFYNIIVLLEIVGRPLWWFVMLLIPLVNIVFAFLLTIDLAKSFGKGIGFAM